MSISPKSELRKSILKLRDDIPQDTKKDLDDMITERVLSVFSGPQYDTLLTYVSFRSEVSTKGIILRLLKAGVKVAVPRVEGEDIRFYHISSPDDLAEGYMGIPEPKPSCMPWEMKTGARDSGAGVTVADTVILVPGSVFDKKGNRIGYGGGFYDRFLAKHQGMYSIGLAYDCQIADEIPADEWDRKVDAVITPGHSYPENST